ncbi:MAG: transporter substrate-binding domain-containing protein [Desulfamplus sp.]|nr:transporter substrate-binding domain-containing protein [Desulfamplus sp.]
MIDKIVKNIVMTLVVVMVMIPYTLLAEELIMGVGLALPPYFIEESNSGFELDIIKESLKFKGHTVNFKFIPFARIPIYFSEGKVNCVSTINENSGIEAHYSDNHVSYQNFAITLKSNNVVINSIADLKDKEVLAFQNAKLYLGKEFAEMAEKNPKYEEIASQQSQTIRLYLNRTQVFIGDGNIFKYYSKQVADKADTTQEVVFHSIFPKTDYKVAFNSEQLMKEFNEGLHHIKSSGLYDTLLSKYIK